MSPSLEQISFFKGFNPNEACIFGVLFIKTAFTFNKKLWKGIPHEGVGGYIVWVSLTERKHSTAIL